MTDTVTADEIVITRVFDAPRERLWAAWTTPEGLARWWGKRGWNTPVESVTVDPRPGGVFRLNSISEADGREMPMDARFREVVEPERLVMGPPDDTGTVTTVTFTDLGDGRTEMVFRTIVEMGEDLRASAHGGLTSAFDRLQELLA